MAQTMYVDAHCIVDTMNLIAADTCDGEGSHDGMYFIGCLLAVSGKIKRIVFAYPSQASRDSAFLALGAMVKTMEALLDEETQDMEENS